LVKPKDKGLIRQSAIMASYCSLEFIKAGGQAHRAHLIALRNGTTGFVLTVRAASISVIRRSLANADGTKPARQRAAHHPADDLSFMKRWMPRGTGVDYWNIEATGRYDLDCEKGKELAREYLAYIGQHPTFGNATLLGCIVGDMAGRVADRGRLSGVEIAFLQCINEAALFTAAYAPQAGA
jgi:hypothetical protein